MSFHLDSLPPRIPATTDAPAEPLTGTAPRPLSSFRVTSAPLLPPPPPGVGGLVVGGVPPQAQFWLGASRLSSEPQAQAATVLPLAVWPLKSSMQTSLDRSSMSAMCRKPPLADMFQR